MSALTDDGALAFAEGQSELTGSDALFDVLVDLTAAYVRRMQTEDAPDPERPETFAPQTLGGVSYVDAALNGLRENLDLIPDLS